MYHSERRRREAAPAHIVVSVPRRRRQLRDWAEYTFVQRGTPPRSTYRIGNQMTLYSGAASVKRGGEGGMRCWKATAREVGEKAMYKTEAPQPEARQAAISHGGAPRRPIAA